jgi:hypothetical protein
MMSSNRLPLKIDTAKLLIAPCGMNCALCYAYQRTKNHCPGCRVDDVTKAFSCINCRIKNCENFNDENKSFCYECNRFPCERLKHLDKRYRTKYNMSMIENLEYIKNNGLKKFIGYENKRWACKNCGDSICVHKNGCLKCSN